MTEPSKLAAANAHGELDEDDDGNGANATHRMVRSWTPSNVEWCIHRGEGFDAVADDDGDGDDDFVADDCLQIWMHGSGAPKHAANHCPSRLKAQCQHGECGVYVIASRPVPIVFVRGTNT